ncbi:Nif3-like dinuclear metal center hexameric protein [Alkalimarinus alittae]|uniref:Nif3-like dinuclear metal center hexameric protein n=1 Tax=Alkalimarinus alittae TaxID=2961619 RepID=A0ABY6MZJ2_9ALTE|nr:Nif3-like dinuclear metal center hexameric protein [Alkalimarinus alittae]UZE95192.1 Nif3-like dinuclear metal center hexameric protein [Alkalimarinus alittae]
MATLDAIVEFANKLMLERPISDYCPNGLQVEGRSEVKKIVSGVTASQALVDEAIARGADLLLVHHGYFWKGEQPTIVGIKRARIKALLENDMSLLAYHLPLDVHAELGNNVQFAELLELSVDGPLDPEAKPSVGLVGRFKQPITVKQFADLLQQKLSRPPQVITNNDEELIERVGWCTGGAQGYIEKAIAAKVDAYVSGEISEPTVHIARESGVHYFAAGHHATERCGAMALGKRLAEEFGLEHEFVDIDNPV